MDKLKNFRMEFRRDSEKSTDCFVYLKAELEPPSTDDGDGARRIRELDFFFWRADFETFTSRFAHSGQVFRDGYRRCEVVYGDTLLFTDQTEVYDFGREIRETGRGTARVPLLYVECPAFVRHWMGRVAKRVWDNPAWLAAAANAAGDYHSWDIRPVIPIGNPARWRRLYGTGKGHVTIDMDQSARERLDLARKTVGFDGMLERVVAIARNSTRGFHQTARLALHRDCGSDGIGSGFTWAAYSPRGKFIMNGGLLFHGKHDGYGSGAAPVFAVTLEPTDGWSIHT